MITLHELTCVRETYETTRNKMKNKKGTTMIKHTYVRVTVECDELE